MSDVLASPQMARSFPTPEDMLALLDIDGTLVSSGYQPTDDRIYLAIQDAQDAGWSLGLSSDTPYEAMILWRERFGLNGPLIAEKGALVENDGQISYDQELANAFKASQELFEDTLFETGAVIWKGNPVEAVKDGTKIGSPGDVVVMINSFRRTSLGFFVRTVNQHSELVINNTLTSLVINQARGCYPDFNDIVEDINHESGLLIAARNVINKRAGSLRLMQAMQVGQFAMIGNSIGDYVGSDIALHYAVGDATSEYKQKADYISEKPLTGGVVDILDNLVEVWEAK
jgi:hydroxymethylpyrimidine pyrophosphatase-like HAD family hydrolase